MTRTTLFLAAFVALLLSAFLLAAIAHRGGPPWFTVRHEVEIAAPAEVVWAILADIAAYPSWNPYVLEVDGELRPGETLRVRIAQDDWAEPRVVAAELTRAAEGELRWRGTIVTPGVFDTEHSFLVVALEGGRSRLVQEEAFRGWLARWFRARVPEEDPVLPGTARAFAAMDLALKQRAEARQGGER